MAQRIDKWLVYARFVRHRARAQALVEQGHVRINRERVTRTSCAVKRDDILTLTLGGRVSVVRVLAEAERRGPPSSAAVLYQLLAGEAGAHGRAAEKQDAPPFGLC